MFLTRAKLLKMIAPDRITAAIREAESHCTAEIRVSVSDHWWGQPRKRAEKAFLRLGMAKTEHRNGVLIYLMPFRRRFSVIGDEGIHTAVGQAFWDAIAAAMAERFRSGDFTGGLEHGIAEAGARLAEHFPLKAGTDRNELSDQVDLDG